MLELLETLLELIELEDRLLGELLLTELDEMLDRLLEDGLLLELSSSTIVNCP